MRGNLFRLSFKFQADIIIPTDHWFRSRCLLLPLGQLIELDCVEAVKDDGDAVVEDVIGSVDHVLDSTIDPY